MTTEPLKPKTPKKKKRAKEVISLSKKEKLVAQSMKLIIEGESYEKIAMKLKVPKTTLRRYLANAELYSEFIVVQKKAIAQMQIEASKKFLKEALRKIKEMKGKELVVSHAILVDKVYPPQPRIISKTEIGDKKIEIIYPNWQVRSKRGKRMPQGMRRQPIT